MNSNGDPNVPHDAGIFQCVAETLAKDKVTVLLMPEHKNLRYFAYTAPQAEIRQGYASTPEQMRRVYPSAFIVINIADGPMDARHDDLVAAVKRGDILLFRAWRPDPYNDKVKAIYRESLLVGNAPPPRRSKERSHSLSESPSLTGRGSEPQRTGWVLCSLRNGKAVIMDFDPAQHVYLHRRDWPARNLRQQPQAVSIPIVPLRHHRLPHVGRSRDGHAEAAKHRVRIVQG